MDRPGWQPPEELAPGERRFVLLFAGVWLIFLAWPLAEVLTSPANGTAARITGVASIVAFAVLYLSSFSWPRPLKRLSLPANTAVQTVALALLIAAAVPSAGATVAGMVPFVMALWMFTHRVVLAMTGAVVTGIAGSAATIAIAGDAFQLALITPIIFTAGILTMFRLAFERSEIERQLSERVALTEQREELARAVHDALGHSLTSITVQAQLATRLIGSDPAAAEMQLEGILSTARDSLRDIRSTVEFLDAPGLAEQLELARVTLTAAGIEPEMPHPEELPELDAGHRRVFTWCLREAVTNVIRHSGASRCRVEILRDTSPDAAPDSVPDTPARPASVLRVTDDGTGIPGGMSGDAVAAGTGLRGLARRAERAHATLSLADARPGTILEVRA